MNDTATFSYESFRFRSKLFTFGNASKLSLRLSHNPELRSKLFTFGNASKLSLRSLNHNLCSVQDVDTLAEAREVVQVSLLANEATVEGIDGTALADVS